MLESVPAYSVSSAGSSMMTGDPASIPLAGCRFGLRTRVLILETSFPSPLFSLFLADGTEGPRCARELMVAMYPGRGIAGLGKRGRVGSDYPK